MAGPLNMGGGKTALGRRFFTPRSIALIGVSADEGAFGTLYLESLLKFGFKGKLYPVNPRRGSIFGLTLFPSVADIPGSVDLAIISVPKRAVPTALEECVAKGIKAAVVVSAGFSETGEEGKRLEEEMIRVTAKGIRIIGPNCFGLYCPRGGLTIIPGKDFPKESGPVERSGLELPAFSAKGQRKISSHLPPVIAGVRNPIDLGNPIPPGEVLVPVLEAVAGDEQIDTILMGGIQLSVKGPSLAYGLPKSFEQGRKGLRKIPVGIKEEYGKPLVIVLNEETSDAGPIGMEFEADRRNLRDYYLANGIPVYPTLNRAAKALANVIKYKERFRQRD